jgi:hypothetical protein
MRVSADVTTLYRPVGPEELELIRRAGFRAFPPRLPAQPIFYPVLSEAYAVRIARDWNVKASGAGCVTRFAVLASFLASYPIRKAGGSEHLEYWIPAEELPAFNRQSSVRSRWSPSSGDERPPMDLTLHVGHFRPPAF